MNHLSYGLHSGFFRRAEESPLAPALEIGTQVYTYRELACRAVSIASSIKKGTARVGLLAPKCVEMYAGILGVLASGSAYVPLDISYPEARLQFLVENAELDLILYSPGMESLARKLADSRVETREIPTREPPGFAPEQFAEIDGRTPAYLLYTSGSSGQPKGILVRHGNICPFLEWAVRYFPFLPEDRFSGHPELGFDASLLDTFACWWSGACLCPLPGPKEKNFAGSFIREKRLSIWVSVPSAFHLLQASKQIQAESLGTLRMIVFIGETLSPNLVHLLRETLPSVRIFNLYGPTEASVACTAHEVTGRAPEIRNRVPIGINLDRATGIFLMKEEGTMAGAGEEGEIYVRGPQVVEGYWKNEAESRKRFVPHPLGGDEIVFRTGDRALLTEQGAIFLGREDGQIKVRGIRVELGEIESALNGIPGTLSSVVVWKKGMGTFGSLHAYVEAEARLDESDLLRALRERIPEHMLPAKIQFVESLKRNENGKIDRSHYLVGDS